MATYDISATGFSVFIKSSESFKNGFYLEGLADDSDPLSFEELTLAETETNVNGDLVVFGKPQVLNPKLSVIAGSPADNNLQALLSARQNGVKELIEITISYPDGSGLTASGGVMTTGTKGKSVVSSGRTATRTYGFAFGVHNESRA